jgi:hypothetical protein
VVSFSFIRAFSFFCLETKERNKEKFKDNPIPSGRLSAYASPCVTMIGFVGGRFWVKSGK